jgi:secondary thiamine-phosphate synthase enzyme
MVRQETHDIILGTQGRGLYEITAEVARLLARSGMLDGLITLQIHHTSASLVVQENADPEVRRDLERFFSRLVPDGDPIFQHTSEGEDDMPAHVRSALTAVTLSLPFRGGRLTLGTWQGIYVWEHRSARHHRAVTMHLLGEP